jgi:hypothetical protein
VIETEQMQQRRVQVVVRDRLLPVLYPKRRSSRSPPALMPAPNISTVCVPGCDAADAAL